MKNDQDVVIDLLIVRLSGRDCALPLTILQEVVPYATLLKPPTMPAALEGFLNLAGVMHPVIRLDRVLGLPEFSIGMYTPILVLKNFSRPLAFLAEAAVRVVKVKQSDLHPLPAAETWNGCVKAEFTWNGSAVALLDAEKLLGLEEASALREFSKFSEAGAMGLGAGAGRPA